MGDKTGIQFTHHTWSMWRGCEHASLSDGTAHPGCTNCYAETMSKRNPAVLGEWGPAGARPIGAEAYLKLPYKWDRAAKESGERRRVFPSLMDPFEDRPDLVDFRHGLFRTIDACPNLDFLLFTKRARLIQELWEGGYRKNVWLIYSASDQVSLDDGVPSLLQCGHLARVLGLSAEPLLGELDLQNYVWPLCLETKEVHDKDHEGGMWCNERGLDWVIVGGESGHNARPCDVRHIRNIVHQCKDALVPVFVKQLGAGPTSSEVVFDTDRGIAGETVTTPLSYITDKKGGDQAEWPEDLCIREFPR